MKKILIIFITTLFININLHSQIKQGVFIVGGDFSTSWGSTTTNPFDKSKLILAFTPDVGYFITNNFLLGISTPIQIVRPEGINTGVLGISPFARFYFGEFQSFKFFFVGKAGYNDFVKVLYGTQQSNQNATSYLGSGISLILSKQVVVEGILKYENTFSDNTSPGSAIGFEFGVQFALTGYKNK